VSVTPPRIDVFIEGSKDPSPAGRARLAAAIAEKFGMPQDKIEQGLAAGRVRAKAGADPQAAQLLKTQLEAIGAIVGLVDVAPVAKVEPVRPPAGKVEPQRGSPPVARATPIASPPPPAAKPPPPPHTRYESGLAAAFDGRGTGQSAAIAALDRIAQAPQDSISLASLDGVDMAAKPPAATPVAAAPSSSAKNLFAPPSEQDEPVLELARPMPRTPTSPGRPSVTPSSRPSLTPSPPLPAPTPTPPPVARSGAVSRRISVPPGPAPEVAPPAQVLDLDRKRWLAGLALALVLGFVVAHLWGLSAEGRYDGLRADAVATTAPITDDEYALALDRHHLAVTSLERAHSRARLTAGILWLLVGAGVVLAERRYGHLVLKG
jgi:hypothetical protein